HELWVEAMFCREP
ncbi:hypothetical protein D043_2309B, partial [Vibrio parahaemolyticus EKP-021]